MHRSVGNPLGCGQPASSHRPKEEWLLPSKGLENVADEWVKEYKGQRVGRSAVNHHLLNMRWLLRT